MKRKNIYLLLGAFLTLIGYLFSYLQNKQIGQIYPITPISQTSPKPPTPLNTPNSNVLSSTASATLVRVIRIVDGDTIEIEGGEKVRYIGINAPESVAPGKQVKCFGKEASNKNKELVLGKEVRLEKDISEADKYGRLLRYVHLGSVFVNDELVREGYVRVSTYPPDVKYQTKFLESEKYAKEFNLGLWSKCGN